MKKNMVKFVLVLLLALVSMPASAIELDLSEIGFPIEKVEMHGFFSQGYMKSSENNVFGKSHDGTMELRDFGVNFSGNLTDDIMLAVQFAGYSLGEQGADKVNLHYGLVDYNISSELGFRMGRVRVPLGLYNETRDIDMLRSSIFMPQSIYPENARDYFASANAAAIYGGFDLGNLGFITYQAHTGKLVNDDDPDNDLTYMFRGLGFENNKYENGRSSGAQILWDTPVEGLRGAWSWRRIDNTLFGDLDIPGVGVTRLDISVSDHSNNIWSVEYQMDKLTLMSEMSHIAIEGRPDSTGWYAGVDYAFTEKLSLGGNYSNYSGERGGNADPDSISGYQRTVSLYGKYSITDTWLVKAQVDMNRGTATNHAMMRSADDEVSSTLFAIKSSWSF